MDGGDTAVKILVISHTCFSTYNNMGRTFLSLFSTFLKEELCQLYIYPSLPDVDVCNSYYRVTDKDVLKSLLCFRKPGGPLEQANMTFGNPAAFENSEDAAVYRHKRNSTAKVRLLRDVMWKMSHWYTPSLRQWLDEQKPECIFLAPGYAEFIYDIARKISRDYNLPIVTYLCDDYYFVREPKEWIGRWQLARLRKKMDALMQRTSRLVTICEEMKTAYTCRFGVPTEVIMTGSDIEITEKPMYTGKAPVISYFGNLSLNRFRSVAEVGSALDRINSAEGTDCRLDLYTPELNEEMKQAFANISAIHFCGFVTGEAFRKAMEDTDFLLHVEAFDTITTDLVKYSISTKIADSLASGIPLLAYGPENVASMRHLMRNECAFTAVTRESLEAMLLAAMHDDIYRKRVLDNAEKTAEEYHHRRSNSEKLKQIFDDLQRNKR